jgi:Ni/Co efflux regulator RcnB
MKKILSAFVAVAFLASPPAAPAAAPSKEAQ